jgi:hypothetical protein
MYISATSLMVHCRVRLPQRLIGRGGPLTQQHDDFRSRRLQRQDIN